MQYNCEIIKMSRAKRILALAMENYEENDSIPALNVIGIDDSNSSKFSVVDNVIIELIDPPNVPQNYNMENSLMSPTSDNFSTEPTTHAESLITLPSEENAMFRPSHISTISLNYASPETASGTSIHDESLDSIVPGPQHLMHIPFNESQNGEADHISDESNVNNGLVPYSDHSDSDMSLDYPKKSKIRKKRFQVDTEKWISEKNKKLRERGLRYLGRGKTEGKWVYDIKKGTRLMKPRCLCKETKKGTLKCSSITEAERRTIFDYFWSLNWGEKKIYIDSTVSVIPTNRPRNRKKEDTSRRSQTYLYHLRLNDSNIRVCRVMFLNTLSIGRMTVLEWKRQTGPHKKITKNIKNTEKVKPFDKENKELTSFIKSLPTMESHYCRASTNKNYLLPEWQSKNSLYRFYVNDWCKPRNISPLSITTFNQTFDSHNIALFQPKKDQCEKCSAYKVGHIPESEYISHIERKEEARMEKDNDKKNESLVFTLDLQAVLLAPKSKVSSLYYKTKLCVHNLCFYNLRNKDGYCYLWNETEGGLNAEEFATICARFITEKVVPTVERHNDEQPINIILYSDGCTYQNRNVTVSNALLNVAITEKISIEQKYLEVGHTQMEADSMHSTIERFLRNRTINVPADYYGICRDARRNPNKYDVTYLNHNSFRNFTKVQFFKSIRPGKKKGYPKVTDLRAIKYHADGQVSYKLRFKDDWKLLPQRRTNGVNACQLDELDQLHSERLKIKKRKFDDLQALKHILADDYHQYYDNLSYE